MRIHIYKCECLYIYLCTYIYIYIYLCVCVCVCVWISIYVFIYQPNGICKKKGNKFHLYMVSFGDENLLAEDFTLGEHLFIALRDVGHEYFYAWNNRR